MDIGEKIKVLRQSRNLTLEEVGKALGYNGKNIRSSIDKIEKGKQRLPINKLHVVADFFNVPVKYFFDNESEVISDQENHNIVEEQRVFYQLKGKIEPKSKQDLLEENRILVRENNILKTILINNKIDLSGIESI